MKSVCSWLEGPYLADLCSSSVVKEINRINDIELSSGTNASWHDEYKGLMIYMTIDLGHATLIILFGI